MSAPGLDSRALPDFRRIGSSPSGVAVADASGSWSGRGPVGRSGEGSVRNFGSPTRPGAPRAGWVIDDASGSRGGLGAVGPTEPEAQAGERRVGDPAGTRQPEASATARRPGRARDESPGVRGRLDEAPVPAGARLPSAGRPRRRRPGHQAAPTRAECRARRIFMQLESPFCRPYRYRGRAHRTAG